MALLFTRCLPSAQPENSNIMARSVQIIMRKIIFKIILGIIGAVFITEIGEDAANSHMENEEEILYSIEEYGMLQEHKQEFLEEETGEVFYYFETEKFFFHDDFPNAVLINQTLQSIYAKYEDSYTEEAEAYQDDEESLKTPYEYWHMLSISYIGEDYVSILYNAVSYMGGAHPYSQFDGITIDCKTGEEVSASQLMGKSDDEILTEISNRMGLDIAGTWDEIDYYLTDSEIVFFYRMPGYWEDVVLERGEILS